MELERAAWQRRIEEIESLITEKSYPEAKRLAGKLAAEPGVPAEVGMRARELAGEAEKALKSIFDKTRFSTEDNHLQNPPL